MSTAEDRRSWAEETLEQRSNEEAYTPTTLTTDMRSINLNPVQTRRPRSAASHRSKGSTWGPVDRPNTPYVQNHLTKLFRLRYGDDENLIIKRVYHQLDWRDRGYLYQTAVERCCIEALEAAKLSINHKEMTELVRSGDLDQDGKCRLGTLICSCSVSRDHSVSRALHK